MKPPIDPRVELWSLQLGDSFGLKPLVRLLLARIVAARSESVELRADDETSAAYTAVMTAYRAGFMDGRAPGTELHRRGRALAALPWEEPPQ